MMIAPDHDTRVEHLQRTLRAAHWGRIRNLSVTVNEDGVELAGEATCFYAVQLVIRDVLAAHVRIHRIQIRVRPSS